MPLGPHSSDEPELMMDINTTPLIDVMLVLIIMLIITIPIQLHSVNLAMPVGAPPSALIEPEKINLDIDQNSQIFWNGELLSDRNALEIKMKSVLPQQPVVVIKPNRAASYAVVAAVLAASQRLGLQKLVIANTWAITE